MNFFPNTFTFSSLLGSSGTTSGPIFPISLVSRQPDPVPSPTSSLPTVPFIQTTPSPSPRVPSTFPDVPDEASIHHLPLPGHPTIAPTPRPTVARNIPNNSRALITFFAPAIVLAEPCENILTETCLSDHGFIPVMSPQPFIFCPDGTLLQVQRSAHDRRTFIHAQLINTDGPTPFLGFGFSPRSGRPVKLLLDTGAGIIVLREIRCDLPC